MSHGGDRITFIDRIGDRFELKEYSEADHTALTHMYDRFTPKAVTQGLPPANDRARLEWIRYLEETGENFLAWLEDIVVAHSSLLPEPAMSRGEYLIFVDPAYRNRGLGTELTRLAITRAGQLQLQTVWLTVEALNFKAIKLYKKIGFQFCDTGERERTMILKL
ncbi:MAG: GNAT family N-acetyltransferase [Thermodesulfobacteriota bacterium]